MAISAVNLSYIGAGPTAAGQILASNDPGPLAKVLVGYGTATLDGSSTTFTVNFIDGVQKLEQSTVLLQLLSATAAATLGGVANQQVFTTANAATQIPIGTSVTTAGFSNSGNNGTFTVTGVSTNTIQVTNSSGVAETNGAATMTFPFGPAVKAVQISRSGANSDTAAVSTTVQPSALSNTGFTTTISAAGSNAQLLSFAVQIFLAS